MTLSEIEKSLPRGLENAIIRSVTIQYDERLAEINMFVLSAQSQPLPYRILLKGFLWIVIEPPHSNYFDDYLNDGPTEITVSNSEAHRWASVENTTTHLNEIPLPKGAFRFRLLVHDWNAYIHIAAMDAVGECQTIKN
jgi:hypothetical protein